MNEHIDEIRKALGFFRESEINNTKPDERINVDSNKFAWKAFLPYPELHGEMYGIIDEQNQRITVYDPKKCEHNEDLLIGYTGGDEPGAWIGCAELGIIINKKIAVIGYYIHDLLKLRILHLDQIRIPEWPKTDGEVVAVTFHRDPPIPTVPSEEVFWELDPAIH